MKLKEYLEWKRVGKSRAAKELKISRQYLFEILRERMIPGRELAQRIVEWTGNSVTFQDLWK